MWIKRSYLESLIKENEILSAKIAEYEDDSGEALIHRLTALAKVAKIDTHSDEYQTMMSRVFMDIGGRESKVLKAYSGTAFMKDNPEEILQRLKAFTKEASVITRELEDKTKKKA